MNDRECKVRVLDGSTVLAEITAVKEIYKQDVYDVQLTELITFNKLWIKYTPRGRETSIPRNTWFHNITPEELLTNSIWKLRTECDFTKEPILITDMYQLLRVGLMVKDAYDTATRPTNDPRHSATSAPEQYPDTEETSPTPESSENRGYLVIYESMNSKYLMCETLAPYYNPLQNSLRNPINDNILSKIGALAINGNELAKVLLDEAQDLVADGVESSIAYDLIFSVVDSISRDSIYSLPIELIPANVDTPEALLRGPGTLEKMLVLSRVCSSCE